MVGRRRLWPVVAFAAVLSQAGALRPAEAGDLPFEASALPPGWAIEREIVVPEAELAGFGARLGGRLASLTNQFVSMNGYSVRVNRIRVATEEDARAVEKTMTRLRGGDFVARRGSDVYEVAGDNVLVARRVLAALGLGSRTEAVWEVSFAVALVDALDYSAANRVFNHFLALERGTDEAAVQDAIRTETRGWTFGRTLCLGRVLPGLASGPDSYRIEPRPQASTAERLAFRLVFADPPVRLGVPYVEVSGRMAVSACFTPREGEVGKGDLGPTRFWPTEAPRVREIAAAALEGASGDVEQVLALLRRTNEIVRYGGATGSRDGVLEVLERGYGRCWDLSDVFVTLCRAAGIPARQVGGWVPPLAAGHIWAEVHLPGGWIPVDATTRWLGTSEDYIPLFVTDDGAMPIVYLGLPRVRRLEGEPDRPAPR